MNWPRVSARIQAGDDRSFEIYFNCFFDLMFAESRRISGRDEATCLDLVQNAMFRATRSMTRLKDEQHAVAWTRILIRCTALDWLKVKSNAMPNRLDNTEPETEEVAENIDVRARILWIENQLEKCHPETRKMIALRYRLGWSLQRIAARFGLKTGAVDGRIRRTIEKIKGQALLEEFE